VDPALQPHLVLLRAAHVGGAGVVGAGVGDEDVRAQLSVGHDVVVAVVAVDGSVLGWTDVGARGGGQAQQQAQRERGPAVRFDRHWRRFSFSTGGRFSSSVGQKLGGGRPEVAGKNQGLL